MLLMYPYLYIIYPNIKIKKPRFFDLISSVLVAFPVTVIYPSKSNLREKGQVLADHGKVKAAGTGGSWPYASIVKQRVINVYSQLGVSLLFSTGKCATHSGYPYLS